MVSGDGVAVDLDKISAVANWPTPRNVHDVESFLGFANYHRDHIAVENKCLYDLIGPKAEFCWQKELQTAFERMKELLICAPVLALPQKEGTFILDCHALDLAVGPSYRSGIVAMAGWSVFW